MENCHVSGPAKYQDCTRHRRLLDNANGVEGTSLRFCQAGACMTPCQLMPCNGLLQGGFLVLV